MTEQTSPAVSVMMTAYNSDLYIEAAIRSILDQSFADFEMIIIDDGSTDQSLAIIEKLAAQDGRIRCVSRPNRGITASRNEALALCIGKYMAVMDSDDIARPDRLAKQVAYLEGHPECVLVGSRVTIIDPDGSPLMVMEVPLEHEEIDAGLMAAKGQLIYHSTVVIRRDMIEVVGPYRQEYDTAEDLDLFLKLAEVGRIVNLAEPLVCYREHFSKVGHTRIVHQAAVTKDALVAAYRRRGLEPPSRVLDAFNWSSDPVGKQRAWGWWALKSGYVATARKHARASLAASPLSIESWRLLYCAMRGR